MFRWPWHHSLLRSCRLVRGPMLNPVHNEKHLQWKQRTIYFNIIWKAGCVWWMKGYKILAGCVCISEGEASCHIIPRDRVGIHPKRPWTRHWTSCFWCAFVFSHLLSRRSVSGCLCSYVRRRRSWYVPLLTFTISIGTYTTLQGMWWMCLCSPEKLREMYSLRTQTQQAVTQLASGSWPITNFNKKASIAEEENEIHLKTCRLQSQSKSQTALSGISTNQSEINVITCCLWLDFRLLLTNYNLKDSVWEAASVLCFCWCQKRLEIQM